MVLLFSDLSIIFVIKQFFKFLYFIIISSNLFIVRIASTSPKIIMMIKILLRAISVD